MSRPRASATCKAWACVSAQGRDLAQAVTEGSVGLRTEVLQPREPEQALRGHRDLHDRSVQLAVPALQPAGHRRDVQGGGPARHVAAHRRRLPGQEQPEAQATTGQHRPRAPLQGEALDSRGGDPFGQQARLRGEFGARGDERTGPQPRRRAGVPRRQVRAQVPQLGETQPGGRRLDPPELGDELLG
jgi:hypothetical protein